MQERLQTLKEEALAQIQQASSMKEVQDIRVKYLGKKGPITEISKGMGKLSPEERPKMG
ncbi:MAG: phenylalanine--tRNA ligase subunit alpha, partial [Anaerobacillus sp.]